MEARRGKRGRGKTTGGHGRVAEKKKKTQVMNDKEEQDRLEAASVLSTLMFLPPKSSGGSGENSPVSSEPNGIVSTTSTVTYISAAPSTGIPTRGPPLQRTQSVIGGSGAGKVTVAATNTTSVQNNRVIIAQLQNQINCILKNGQTPPQIQLMMPLQTMQVQALRNASVSAALSKGSSVPSVVTSAEHTKLPVTVTLGQTVNKDVASALRQAVNSTNKIIVTDHPTVKTKDLPKSLNVKKEITENPKISFASSNLLSSSVTDSEVNSISIKKENSDNTLPLKKRRLIAVGQNDNNSSGEADSKADQNENSRNISSTQFSQDLTTATQMENIIQMARDYSGNKDFSSTTSIVSNAFDSKTNEGYRPVQIDPRTSLMILSDVKLALTPDQDGDLPIHIAVVHMNLQLVKKLIDIMGMTGKSVDRYNKLHQTPLHLAVLVDQPEIVKALLVAGANPNLVDRLGRTSLHIAIAKRFSECLRTVYAFSRNFSKVEIRLNTRNYEGYPPLHTCIDVDDFNALEFLVKNGANVDIQDGKAGRSALFYAVENNRARMVDYLILNRASADMQNYAGISPLMVAQSGNMTEVLQLLQKALDLTKTGEEPEALTKKIPIPRIPSKASMIVSETASRSRSNSIDQQLPAMRGRQQSVSSCSSPIDLSVHRNTESPKENTVLKGKGDNSLPIGNSNTVKEKHMQLVAALESRQGQVQGQSQGQNVVNGQAQSQTQCQAQVISSNVNEDKHKQEQLLAMQHQATMYTLALAQAKNEMANKSKGDSESLVTSSSDIKQENEEERVTGSGESVVSATVCDNAMDTDDLRNQGIDKPAEKIVETHNDYDKEKAREVVISVPDEGPRSKSPELPEAMETGDSQSVSNSPACTSKSPEMPVLSRMASFTNDQESCTASLDLPDIENEEAEDSNDNINNQENSSHSTCVTQSQISLESLSSSQGFETSIVFIKKPIDLETEGEASLDGTQKSDLSDDSVEIDSNTIAKARLSMNDKIISEKNKMETDIDVPNSVETNDLINEMEIDEDDDDKPLVIDEDPVEKQPGIAGKTTVESAAKESTGKVDPVEDNSNGEHHDKFDTDHTLDKNNLIKAKSYLIVNKQNTNNDGKGMNTNTEEVVVDKDAILSKTHSNVHSETSNSHTDVAVTSSISDSKVKKATSEKLNDTNHLDKVVAQNATDETLSATVGVTTCDKHVVTPTVADNDKVLSATVEEATCDVEKTLKQADTEKPGTNNSTESGEPNLSSVDHVFKEGKAHTLFYHDGEGYKPIRIFIDNSEQSSLVLQRMLQANFASMPPKQKDKSKQAEIDNKSKFSSKEKDVKSASKLYNDVSKEKNSSEPKCIEISRTDKHEIPNKEPHFEEKKVNNEKKFIDDKLKSSEDKVKNDEFKVNVSINKDKVDTGDYIDKVDTDINKDKGDTSYHKDQVINGIKSASSSQSEANVLTKDKKADTTGTTQKEFKEKISKTSGIENEQSVSDSATKAKLDVLKTLAREATQTYQMAYINSLKHGSHAKNILDKQSKVHSNKQTEYLPSSDSTEAPIDPGEHKHIQISAGREKAFHEGFLAATKRLGNTVPSSHLNKDFKVRNTSNDSKTSRGDNKTYDINSLDNLIKLQLKQDSRPSSSTPVSARAAVSVSSTSASSNVLAISSSLFEQISQKQLSSATAIKPSGFHAGRSSLPEGTLTHINPDIKNRLSMALQSPQRKLSKPNIGTVPDLESKLSVSSKSFESAQKISGVNSLASHTVSESRQQL